MQLQKDGGPEEESSGFFWDPPSSNNRESKAKNQSRLLQDQLTQATMKINDLESELKKMKKVMI